MCLGEELCGQREQHMPRSGREDRLGYGRTRKVFVAGAARKRMEEAAPVFSCSQQPWPDVLPWGSVSTRSLWRNRASGNQRERSRPRSRKSWSTWAALV